MHLKDTKYDALSVPCCAYLTMGAIISLSPTFPQVPLNHTIRRLLPFITMCNINGIRSFSTKQTATTVGSEVCQKEIHGNRLPKWRPH